MNSTKHFTKVAIWTALIASAAIAADRQNGPEPEGVGDPITCQTGYGVNALTIALPDDAKHHIEAVYIRRKGCQEWSKNLGVVLPGKSIHILNLDDGELEVFWRTEPYTLGVRPPHKESPPTHQEWMTNEDKKSLTLSGESHRRIVVT